MIKILTYTLNGEKKEVRQESHFDWLDFNATVDALNTLKIEYTITVKKEGK